MFGDSKSISLLCLNAERSQLSGLQKDFQFALDRVELPITRSLGFCDNSKWPLCFGRQSGCGSGIIPVPCVTRRNNSVDTIVSVAEQCWLCVRFTSNDLKCKDERHPPSKDGRIDNRYRVRGERKIKAPQHLEVTICDFKD